MEKKELRIDFSKKCGKIKPMHGINGGPRSGGYSLPFDFSDEFLEMGTPVVRTVGSVGEYGHNQYVNIHAIFPDFDADETLEESYNFLPTDLYLQTIREVGAEIFYRLGECAEPYARKLYAKSPRDMEKWARICEHIIIGSARFHFRKHYKSRKLYISTRTVIGIIYAVCVFGIVFRREKRVPYLAYEEA